MRHRIHFRRLNRTVDHRRALRRNMAQNLIEHGRITTTVAKAKNLRPFVERLITLALTVRRREADRDPAGALRARRVLHRRLADRAIIPKDHRSAYEAMSDAARHKALRARSGRRHRTGDPRGRLAFTAESVMHRLIHRVAAPLGDRAGGYTRLILLPKRRLGDGTSLATLELVGGESPPTSLTKNKPVARRRRADARYALAVRALKNFRGGPQSAQAGSSSTQPPASESGGP